MSNTPSARPVLVPNDSMAAETLYALAESFVLREGTDYGAQEMSIETKTEQILRQVRSGSVVIVFDPESESATLMNKMDWKKLAASFPKEPEADL